MLTAADILEILFVAVSVASLISVRAGFKPSDPWRSSAFCKLLLELTIVLALWISLLVVTRLAADAVAEALAHG
jgi:hypothetical protein